MEDCVFNRRTFSTQLLPSGKKWSCCKQQGLVQDKKFEASQWREEEKHPSFGRSTGARQQHFPKMQDESPVEISMWAPLSEINSAQPRAHECAALQPQEEVWKAWELTTTKNDKEDSSVAEQWQRNFGGNSKASKPASCPNKVQALREPNHKMA